MGNFILPAKSPSFFLEKHDDAGRLWSFVKIEEDCAQENSQHYSLFSSSHSKLTDSKLSLAFGWQGRKFAHLGAKSRDKTTSTALTPA